jgi:hypothetical protein
MNSRFRLISLFVVGCALAFSAQAAPPDGKGPNHSTGQPGKGKGGSPQWGAPGDGSPGNGQGNPGKAKPGRGNSGKGNVEKGLAADSAKGNPGKHGGLIYAGITAALAREYALDYGFGGYSSLPPGIRKNLARGKPLPPGIAKKMVPGPMLGRLPRYPGYEWRIAGSDLILISVATAVIADILYDVFD